MSVHRSGRNRTRIDYAALNETHTIQEHNVHPHTQAFKEFHDASTLDDKVCVIENPLETFDDEKLRDLVYKTRLLKPILIRGANPNVSDTYNSNIQLSFEIPAYDMDQVTEKVGEDHKVPVMDVMTQNNSPFWNMAKWRDYYQQSREERDKVRNVISLEISETELGREIKIPKIVEDLDIVYKLFEDNSKLNFSQLLDESGIVPPKVQKYILMSIAGSYTDFHIDFAGTSVYYSPISGHKQFILFPPLKRNLEIYKKWCLSDDQNKTWLPSLIPTLKQSEIARLRQTRTPEAYLNNGFAIDIFPGDLLLLPSMWIHSVYTKEDSIIIGGNYLNLLSLKTHLQAHQIEIATRVDEQFKFPNFVKFVWLIAYYLIKNNDYDEAIHEEIVSLLNFLKEQWTFVSKAGGKSFTRRDRLLVSKIKSAIPKEVIGDVPAFLEELKIKVDKTCDNSEEPTRKKLKVENSNT